MKAGGVESIDQYIEGFPPKVQKLLQKIRKTIQNAAPGAIEAISYQIPTFKLNGNLIHFAAFKNHIGLYPRPRVPEFEKALAGYEGGKGTVQFPLDEPIPYDLITRITRYRVQQNVEAAAKAAAKKSKKRAALSKKR
ncbi:MAG TPA: DUF1801 domain-containing protein [Pyrinomonadaceae bacterium]|nr:DUF1801 domain-containing protein [Pyrinomonadaceae bacterium]